MKKMSYFLITGFLFFQWGCANKQTTSEVTGEITKENTVKETVSETTKETAKETVSETTKETVKETVSEVTKETVKEMMAEKVMHDGGHEVVAEKAPDSIMAYSFAKDIYPIFQSNGCTGVYCHGGGGGLSMDTATNAYNQLVNQNSKSGKYVRVAPNKPMESLLYDKISQKAPKEGVMMPKNKPMMSTNELQKIHDWIQQGAQP